MAFSFIDVNRFIALLSTLDALEFHGLQPSIIAEVM